MASGGDAVRKDTANEKRHEGLLDGSNNGRYEEAAHRLRDLQAKYFGPLKRPFTEAALSAKGNAADVREMKEVLQMMREAARCDGCGQASFALGEIYFRGIGVRADAAQAVVWWKLAAEQGESLAHQNLGNIYNYGLNGVDKEYTKAAKYYRLAANQGDTASLFNLAMMYRCGKGVPQNHVEETELITQSANLGYDKAQFALGNMHRDGRGVTKNESTAMKWFRKAAEQGFASAQCIIGYASLHGKGVAVDESMALEWYRKAADQGNMDAQYNLGIMYHQGKGVEQSHFRAVVWNQRAAAKGHAGAQNNLADMYAKGEGVTKSPSEAFKWYRMAAEQGNDLAIDALANRTTSGDTPPQGENRKPPPSDPSFPIGTHVELRDLKAKPELNGRWGVIKQFVASSGRYSVKLDDGSTVKAKPANLLLAVSLAAMLAAGSGVVGGGEMNSNSKSGAGTAMMGATVESDATAAEMGAAGACE